VLVLAIDTATPVVVTGVVELSDPVAGTSAVRAQRSELTTRGHAEILTTRILECLAEAGVGREDLDAVVVGEGPGPFTGLRVGMATGAAFGDALGLPVYGVCSLDAIAAQAAEVESLLVVTDARRKEVYWARYALGRRIEGPGVVSPTELAERLAGERIDAVAGSESHTALFGRPVRPGTIPTVAGLAAVASSAVFGGSPPAALTPLYLRRPDAVELKDRKK
jgi:tRNA threonylcarbamoyl adenosine modification protein YeaZ